jgi:hypothetical protein
VRAGGLDRGGPRREGVEPSSEAVLAEVALSPRARRTPPEGALGPRARRTSPEGASRPRTRRTPPVGCLTLERGESRPRRHSSCHPGGPRGPPGS